MKLPLLTEIVELSHKYQLTYKQVEKEYLRISEYLRQNNPLLLEKQNHTETIKRTENYIKAHYKK